MIPGRVLKAKKVVRRLYKKRRCTRCDVVCVADACWYCWSGEHLEDYTTPFGACVASGPRFEEAA